MRLRQVAGDREPEAQAAVFSSGRAVRLAETLEHMRQERGIDAFSAIRHDDLGQIVTVIEVNVDAPAAG